MENSVERFETAIARLGVLLALLASPLPAATPVSPPVVEYTIRVSLDPKEKTLEGTERLLWRNPSGDPVSELRFHLYLNAFKNNRTTFLRESGGQLRGDRAGQKPGDWGWIDVASMKTADGRDLAPGARFVQPDGNDASDQTVLVVPLPAPVPPHGEIALDIAFRAKLPKIFARTGFVRDYFLVGQWYPKIGVYEPAGMRGRTAGGWNCHAFHANSEFYADYGKFDVTMTVPSRFVVGATGKRVSETKKGDRTSYRYVQDNVHDFAWTADPRYIVVEFRFDPPRDIPAGWSALAAKELGMTEAEIALKPVVLPTAAPAGARGGPRALHPLDEGGPVLLRALVRRLPVRDPDGRGPAGRRRRLGRHGVPDLHHRRPRGRVPHPLAVLPPARHRGRDDPRVRPPVLVRNGRLERVRGILARRGAQHGLGVPLDGAGLRARDRRSCQAASASTPTPWRTASTRTCPTSIRSMRAPGASPRTRPTASIPITRSVSSWRSSRTTSAPRVFARAQRAYFQQWSFRHPSTSDFFDTFERVSGRDLSTYRRHIVDGTSTLDWQVVSARSEKADDDYGVFERGGKKTTYEDGEVVPPGEKKAKHSSSDGAKKVYGTIVLFGNTGSWAHGAKAKLVFEDGTVVERVLPAEARWVRFRIRYKSRLAYAIVDPDRANVWDWNHLNDSKVLRSGGKGRGREPSATGRTSSTRAWAAYLAGLWSQLLWALA